MLEEEEVEVEADHDNNIWCCCQLFSLYNDLVLPTIPDLIVFTEREIDVSLNIKIEERETSWLI